MPYSVKGFFKINKGMVQIMLMLEVLFTQDSRVEDLFSGAFSSSLPNAADERLTMVKKRKLRCLFMSKGRLV